MCPSTGRSLLSLPSPCPYRTHRPSSTLFLSAMASRRLAISSLLCEDESPPNPVAGPSSSSPSPSRPLSGFVEPSTFSTYPTSSQQYVNHSTQSSSSSQSQSEHRIFHPPAVVSPPIPIPRRNERHETRSPERRTRMEMFVDDEPPNRVVLDHHRETAPYNYHPSTSPHTRRQSSHLDRQHLSLADRHDAQYHSPPECSYSSSSSVRPPSSSGPTPSPRQYSTFTYSPTRSPHHVLLSPAHADTSPLSSASQYRRTSVSSDTPFPRTYMAPLDPHYNPHLNPKSSISVQANSPFRLTPVHPASFSSPNTAPPFPTSPSSGKVPPSPRLSPVLARSYGSVTHSPTMPLRHLSNSPTVSKSPLDGFGPLEALVQAATEERRRLSGGSADAYQSAWHGSNRSDSSPSLRGAGASPVLTTAPVPPQSRSPSTHSHSQPRSLTRSRSPEQTTPPTDPDHHLETTYGQLSTSPTVSSTRHLPNESLPEISPRTLHDGEPPLKRRRSSNDSQQERAPLAQHAPHSPMVRTRALSPVTVIDMRAPVRTTPIEPVVPSPGGIPPSPSVSVAGSYHSGLAVSPVTPSNLIGPGQGPSQTYEPPMFDTTAYDGSAPVPVPRRAPVQHDAHEWLAQQYSSSASQSTPSNNSDHVGIAVSHLSTLKLESKSPGPPLIDIRPATRSPVDRRIPLSGPGVSPTHIQRSTLDTDIEMEFDLLASSSVSSSSKRRAPAHDVDDELLSLVDEKPRLSKSPSNRSPIPPPESSRKPTLSQVSSLKQSHSSARSPSLSTQAERDSMPPPALPTGGALSSSKSGSAGSGATQAKKKDSATQKVTHI